jgi:hypothetical protein
MTIDISCYSAMLILVFLSGSCANEADPVADKSNFTRIYDNDKFNTSYFPIDMRQTPDGGYLILGGRRVEDSNFSGVYITKVDERGSFVSEQEVDEVNVNPIGPLMELNGKYYFFCMTAVGLQTQLIEMDPSGVISQTIDVGGSAAAAPDNSNFILLSYDNVSKQSVVSLVTPAGGISKSKGFSIGAGDAVEEPIINHFIRTGRQLPFQVGKTSTGQYYFNGFYNYTFSLVVTDLAGDDPSGVVQGQQEDGGFSQIQLIEGGKFAASRFNFGDNYFLPNVTIPTSGTSSVIDLGGNKLPELTSNAPVHILKASFAGKNNLIYASNTRSKQIALFIYDQANGEFLGSRYLGFSNPFEIANLITTADGGLAVCGTTYVAGRFPRICLFKIGKDEFSSSIK